MRKCLYIFKLDPVKGKQCELELDHEGPHTIEVVEIVRVIKEDVN